MSTSHDRKFCVLCLSGGHTAEAKEQLREAEPVEQPQGSVQRVRIDLMQAATHWNTVVADYDPIAATGPAQAAAGAAASMAHTYSYVLAALLGQMAESGDDRWTAGEAAEFVYDLLANGDSDNFNADVLPATAGNEANS